MSTDIHLLCGRSFGADERALLQSLLPQVHLAFHVGRELEGAGEDTMAAIAATVWRALRPGRPLSLVHLEGDVRHAEAALDLALMLADYTGGALLDTPERTAAALHAARPESKAPLVDFLHARRKGQPWPASAFPSRPADDAAIPVFDDDRDVQLGVFTPEESEAVIQAFGEDLESDGIDADPHVAFYLDDEALELLTGAGVPAPLLGRLRALYRTHGALHLRWSGAPTWMR